MRAQTVNFDRSGTPYEKLGIGRHGIKKALLANPTIIDTFSGDADRQWMENLPEEFQEALDYNSSDPLSFTDYYGFDEDWYLENEAPEEVDYDEFQSDFSPTGSWKTAQRNKYQRNKDPRMHRTYIKYREGKLPEGNKVIHYIDGLGSGYIAHRDWLKMDK